MAIRMTGLASGMDTESMVNELISANSTKVDEVKKDKQLLEWKKETWSTLNTELYNFYTNELSDFKSAGSYTAKKATSSDDNRASVTATQTASAGTHMVSVKQTATSAYLTGSKITNDEGEALKGSTKLETMGIAVGTTFSVRGQDVVVDENTTLSSLATQFSKMGVSANYDEKQGRFYVNSKNTGTENDFSITSSDSSALEALGLGSTAFKTTATDAIIEYNGVEYTGSSNTFSLNGLTITAKAATGNYDPVAGTFTDDTPLSITVETDTDAAYNTIKEFVNAYNALIDKMNTYYDEKTTDYEPLTEAEKAELSETQIEEWEKKAKQGILRRDSTINSLISNMRTTLNKGITVTNDDGTTKTYSLASLGIVTGDYTENGKLHILGDADDATYKSETNKLKEMLSSNPSMVSSVIVGNSSNPGVGSQMYSYMMKAMKGDQTTTSSLTFYADLTMDEELDDYDDEIDKWAEKLQDMEDKYYDQFAAMETAMANLQSQQSYVSSLMGN